MRAQQSQPIGTEQVTEIGYKYGEISLVRHRFYNDDTTTTKREKRERSTTTIDDIVVVCKVPFHRLTI